MSFKILDYVKISYEIKTEVTAVCPCCGGKLKVRKDNQAYKCVSNFCEVASIRKSVGKPINKDRYIPYKPEFDFIEPILVKEGKLQDLTSEELFSIHLPSVIDKEDRVETNYIYSDYFSIKRIDFKDGKSKKQFYPHFKIDNQWFPIWKLSPEEYLPLTCLYKQQFYNPENILLIVEGEKCAEIGLRKLNVFTSTFMGAGFSEKAIYSILYSLRPKAILIIPDADETGFKKAMLIQKIAWKLLIPCTIKIYPDVLSPAKDIADLDDSDLDKIRGGLNKWI